MRALASIACLRGRPPLGIRIRTRRVVALHLLMLMCWTRASACSLSLNSKCIGLVSQYFRFATKITRVAAHGALAEKLPMNNTGITNMDQH